MTEEQFDIVDLKDQLTGQLTTKETAHRNGIPHRVAAVYVFDENNNLLLQVHEGHDGQLDHSVGGHVASGETYKSAAAREMKEEIGLGTRLEEVAVHVMSDERFPGFNYFHFFGIYETHTEEGWQFIPHEEVKRLVPMQMEQIIKDMKLNPDKFTRGFINTLEAYIKVRKLPFKIDKKILLKDRLGP